MGPIELHRGRVASVLLAGTAAVQWDETTDLDGFHAGITDYRSDLVAWAKQGPVRKRAAVIFKESGAVIFYERFNSARIFYTLASEVVIVIFLAGLFGEAPPLPSC